MINQSETTSIQADFENPFIYDRPVGQQGLFINRRQVLGWVENNLKNKISIPLIIEGDPGIGKTSFLYDVKRRGSQMGFISLYVDIKKIPVNSFVDFLWGFGNALSEELAGLEITPPPVEKRMLIVRPWQAFKQRFWQPLSAKFQHRGLLLALDNFDRLASKIGTLERNRAFRQYLYDLLETSQDGYIVGSVTGRLRNFSPEELVPFNRLLSHQLSLLSEERTYELLNLNGIYFFSRPVATYIHSLTWGHPGDVQRLGNAIFERMAVNDYKVITVADVVNTLRSDLKPGDFRKAVYKQRTKVSYIPGTNPEL